MTTNKGPQRRSRSRWKARLAVAGLRGLAWLPLPVLYALAHLIGNGLWLLPNQQRRVAAINLALCLPELNPGQQQRLLRRNLIETSKTLLELGPLWLWSGPRVLALIRQVDGEQSWQDALARGQGAVILTPHLGAWEITNIYLSSRYPLTAMFRPSRQGSGLDDIIRRGRQRLGAQLVPADKRGVKTLLQKLRAGEAIGLLPDQNPAAEGGVFAPFFGQPAYTMILLSRLAQKCRAPVFLIYAQRLSWGQGFCLRLQALPDIVTTGSLEQSVTALNSAIEQAVRQLPEQYLWVYKRFKTRPAGRAKPYSAGLSG